MQIALGIDLSSKALHCAYGADERPFFQVLKLSGQLAESRIAAVADQLGLLLDRIEKRFEPELALLVVERPFVHVNPKTGIVLAQIQSAAMTTAYLKRWQIIEMDPTEIRKRMGIVHSAKKGETKLRVQQRVYEELGMDLDPDSSDAALIWLFAKYLLDNYVTETASACS